MSRCVGLLVLLVSCLVLTNNGIVSNAAVFASQDSASGNALSRIPPCGNGFRWIVNSGSLNRSQDGFPVALQRKYFDSPCTFLVIGKQVSADYKNWTAVPTKTITTIADINEVVADPAVKAVLYEIQAQGAEKDPRTFRKFVEAEAQQARAANPNVIVLAGISTTQWASR